MAVASSAEVQTWLLQLSRSRAPALPQPSGHSPSRPPPSTYPIALYFVENRNHLLIETKYTCNGGNCNIKVAATWVLQVFHWQRIYPLYVPRLTLLSDM